MDIDVFNPQHAEILANGPPDSCIPRFYMRPVHQTKQSEQEGRPIYKDVPFVEIITPGNNKSVVDCKVKPDHQQRWPARWKAFQERHENVESGTPLEQWAYLGPSQVATLKVLNIFTVEQLAEVSEAAFEQMGPGARDLRERARQHLQPAGSTEQELRGEVADLKGQIADLNSKLEQALKQPNRQAGPDADPADADDAGQAEGTSKPRGGRRAKGEG